MMIEWNVKKRIVLGIDAAWTEKEPSGVALIIDDGSGWKLIDVVPSYAAFLSDRDGTSILRHRGSTPDAGGLVTAAELKAGSAPDIVAVDMVDGISA